ncbi:MAG: hypothetical protein NTZ10_03380, partial [Candidatus Saganbacteria bacterium]|nr:hypothetical protein [Candidatus Saganbacteria bacterium]
NAMALALALKYAVLTENAKQGMPVSVAAVLGYEADTTKVSIPGLDMINALGDIGIGAIVSKIMVPWVPYGALVYHSLNQNNYPIPGGTATTTGSRIEVAVGTQMLLSKSSAVVGEFSYNSYNFGTSYTNNQISIAYSAKI